MNVDFKFFIVGAQRSGTTSLRRYLMESPEIGMPDGESDTFLYRDHCRKPIPSKPIKGLCSPYYMFHPAGAERLAQFYPVSKYIMLLRNPVDRAFSHYHHILRLFPEVETLPFEEALDIEMDRLNNDPTGKYFRHMAYRTKGKYIHQLMRWFLQFDEEQTLIIKSEDFYANPKKILDKVTSFIGAKPVDISEYFQYNKDDNTELMDPDIRKRLEEYYVTYNDELYSFLKQLKIPFTPWEY